MTDDKVVLDTWEMLRHDVDHKLWHHVAEWIGLPKVGKWMMENSKRPVPNSFCEVRVIWLDAGPPLHRSSLQNGIFEALKSGHLEDFGGRSYKSITEALFDLGQALEQLGL